MSTETPDTVSAEPRGKRKPRGKPFEKGNRANPGGRPKIPAEVREVARGYTLQALERLAELMDQNDSPAVAVSAAQALLDRAWGKAPQNISAEDEDGNAGKLQIAIVRFGEGSNG
jgi:hypothetical protein